MTRPKWFLCYRYVPARAAHAAATSTTTRAAAAVPGGGRGAASGGARGAASAAPMRGGGDDSSMRSDGRAPEAAGQRARRSYRAARGATWTSAARQGVEAGDAWHRCVSGGCPGSAITSC